MTKKIFNSIITVALIVLLASIFIATSFLYNYFNGRQANMLEEELKTVSANIELAGTDYFKNYESSVFRFTLIADNGSVIYDTRTNADEMENHIDREEIKEALKSGKGSSSRYSSTLTERTLYEAVLLDNGCVLRISSSQLTIGALIFGMLPGIAAIIIAAIIVSLILSGKMSKRITAPLEDLDLEHPTDNNTYEELAPILTKIHKQREQINEQIALLKQKNDEFDQITASMKEGLILIDKTGTVLSINEAAKKLFDLKTDPVGHDILTVDRSIQMNQAVNNALCGKHSEFREQRKGFEYQFRISRIESEGKTAGAVILCVDITESAFAERKRREFTANVSHELKTPLQSIIGSAELLENGLVKPEDVNRFTANIKNEASRLVTLINDIIRLSQLDEGSNEVCESVNLKEVAKEVTQTLAPAAAKKQLTLELNAEQCEIKGIRRYIYEIIYNLCDNAVRYNTEGGRVAIDIKPEKEYIVLKVSDTGIGIPKEDQSRIFERFYRVDKSHSKETGGTGLGLSIVKNAAVLHNADIKLESEIGKGTAITIKFRK